MRRRGLLEVAFLPVVTIAKNKRIIENKLVVIEGIDDAWRAGHCNVARRLHTGSVMMLVPGIHRDRKIAPFLPLESFLLLRLDPDRSRALTLENVNRFFEQMSVRFERFPCGDFRNIGVVETAGSVEIEKRRRTHAARTPWCELEPVEIFHDQTAIGRQAL